jgi:hypothetical protein
MGGARCDGRFSRASVNARPLQRCDATRYAILEAPIRAAGSLATRYPSSPSDTTHSSTVEGIIDAPVSGASLATQCPSSASDTTPHRTIEAILEAPVLATSADRERDVRFPRRERAMIRPPRHPQSASGPRSARPLSRWLRTLPGVPWGWFYGVLFGASGPSY